MEFKGKITKIIYENDTWSSVIMESSEQKKMTVIGIRKPVIDTEYIVWGDIVSNKYGEQLEAASFIIKSTVSMMFSQMLKDIKGIGPKIAEELYKIFGEKLMDIVKDEPDKLSCKYSKRKIKRIVEAYERYGENLEMTIELQNFFKGNISVEESNALIEKYGKDTLDVVNNNPYILMYMSGHDFIEIDKNAIKEGISLVSPYRIEAAIIYVLEKKAGEGNTYITQSELDALCIDSLIRVPKSKKELVDTHMFHLKKDDDMTYLYAKYKDEEKAYIEKYIKLYEMTLKLLNEAKNSLNEIVIEEDRVYLEKYYDLEVSCAEILNEILKKKPVKRHAGNIKLAIELKKFEKINGFSPDATQMDAVNKIFNSRISILSGGPGTGKSTIVKLITALWKDSIYLCASTGKAARRLSETTSMPATTIDSLIYDYINGDINLLKKNSLVIVDEASMMSLALAKDFLYATKDCQIILVGDKDQLPPVGIGNFFAELIKSEKIPVNFLEVTHRNSGSISENCHMIKKGKITKFFLEDEHFEIINVDDAISVNDIVLKKWIEARKKYAPEQIRVLVPVRTKTKSNVSIINSMIRNYENPDAEEKAFSVGDRIMQTKNDYHMSFYEDNIYEAPIYNGETGYIKEIVQFDGDEYYKTILDDGKVALIPVDSKDIELSYATTVHKSQGDEFKCVICVLTNEHSIMLKRNLIYTATSRTKEKMILINHNNSANRAILCNTLPSLHITFANRIAG